MDEFKNDAPTLAILKHNNACGLATRKNLHQAYIDALAGDPVSAFGGGLISNKEIDKEELFQKMCAWDKENYIVAAATSGAGGFSSAGQDDGLVDDHAYSVIECHANVAGTGVDMMKVRNPWGKGEIEDGQFDDDGPGWERKFWSRRW